MCRDLSFLPKASSLLYTMPHLQNHTNIIHDLGLSEIIKTITTSAPNLTTSTTTTNSTTITTTTAITTTTEIIRAVDHLYNVNSLPDLSKLMLDKYLIPSLVYVCVLLLIGIPGNLLVIYVYLLKWNRSTSRTFILSLGCYDLTNCLFSMFAEVALLTHFLDFDYPVVCKVSRFITSCVNSGSSFLLVAIAIDRFLRICRIYSNQIDNIKANVIILVSVVFALVTSWPVLFLYGTQTIRIEVKNSFIEGKTCLISDRMAGSVYPFVYALVLITGHFIIEVLLVSLYSCIGRKIWRQRGKLNKSMRVVGSSISRRHDITEGSVTMEVLDDKTQNTDLQVEKGDASAHPMASSIKKKRLLFKRKRTLLIELKQSVKTKDSTSSTQSGSAHSRKLHAGKTTFMLFLVTLGFIISYLPYSILVLMRYTDSSFYGNLSDTGKTLYQLFLRSYLLNSVLNPIVYCFISKQFRQQSKKGMHSLCNCR